MGFKNLFRFDKIFRRRPHDEAAASLYAATVLQARRPAFYTDFGVPDTVDGRFDMVALHAFLVMRRLRGAGPGAADLSQAVFDIMFADMDQNLREIGVGDLGVGKRIRHMAEAFLGRVAAYEAALTEAGDQTLIEALHRNLFRGTAPDAARVAAMAAYVRNQDAVLGRQPIESLMAGRADFSEPGEVPA